MSNTSATGGYLTPTGVLPEDDDLDNSFLDLIVGLTGLDASLVRPRWQPVDRKMPDVGTNWCAVGVTNDDPDWDAVVTHAPDQGDAGQDNLRRTEVIRVVATFYGPTAKGYAKIARDGLYIPQNREQLEIALLAVITTDTIRAVPEQLNGQWVRRYDLPITFRRTVLRSYAVETILSSEIELYVESAGTEIITNP